MISSLLAIVAVGGLILVVTMQTTPKGHQRVSITDGVETSRRRTETPARGVDEQWSRRLM